jgi:hypothetical protein
MLVISKWIDVTGLAQVIIIGDMLTNLTKT